MKRKPLNEPLLSPQRRRMLQRVFYQAGTKERKIFCFPGGPQSFKEFLNPRGFFEDDNMEELFNEHVARIKGASP
ncbi:hypothetical protein [Halocola ammonii]